MADFADFEPYEDDNPAAGIKLQRFDFDAASPPVKTRFDWRAEGLTFRVRDQDGWNACTSFAYTAMIEARWQLSGSNKPRLCAGYPHGCLGGISNPVSPLNVSTVSSLVARNGHAASQYDALPLTKNACASMGARAIEVGAGRFAHIGGCQILDLLVSAGPLVVDMKVPEDFDNLRSHTVYETDASADGRLHAMLLVGYDYSEKIARLLNSMGAGWGNAGFLNARFGIGGLLKRSPFTIGSAETQIAIYPRAGAQSACW